MKLLLLLLGYYSNRTPFYLYQIPGSTILLFNLSDICALFNVPDLAHHPTLNKVPHGECYCSNNIGGQHDDDDETNGQQHYFLSTQVLSRTAAILNRYRLAELCKLKPNDYIAGLADSILKNITTFERAKDEKGWNLMDLPLSPVTSPVSSLKQGATTLYLNKQGTTVSPRIQSVKSEPLSPPPLGLPQPKEIISNEQHQRPPNPMALGKVLWSKTADRQSPSTRPGADDDASSNNKRQRTERKVLPKPTHTVSSQQSHPSIITGQGQTLLAKRQGKNTRHLTIFAPSYADPLSVAIRSAPLNSSFPQQQQQHQQQQQYRQQQARNTGTTSTHLQQQSYHQHISTTLPQQGYQTSARHPPKTANMLQPRHALAPLLSPRAVPVNSSHRHPEPKTTGGAIGKQEFAIPPIVPSQQQPPHTAHPHHSSTTSSSTLGRPVSLSSSSHQGYSKSTRLDQATTNDNNSKTAMPPQTPTTYSFAALQRQQFLQPFENLFDTIETTRTLKTNLDDQIRRSSTLLQTLQASSTTVEGLVRDQVTEMQMDMTSRLDHVLDSMIKRIGQLEAKLEMTESNSTSTPAPPLKSPTAIAKSQQNEIKSDGYHSILNTLRVRLDRLENQLDN